MMSRLTAELYALTHRGNAGDVAFYAQACRGAESVLELGSGYGRLLPALGRVAKSVVGLELEPAFRKLAREALAQASERVRARVRVVAGDMQRFELGRTFERILVPHSGLYCLPSRAALLACLHDVRRHLAPGGRLLFDGYAAEQFHEQAEFIDQELGSGDADAEPLVAFEHGRRHYRVFEHSRFRRAQQRIVAEYRYRSGTFERRIIIDQRYLVANELRPLLAAASLELESLAGDFAGRRFTKNAPYLVVSARGR